MNGGRAEASTYAWYVAGMLAFAHLLAILDRYLLSVVLDDVKHGLHLTDTQLGILQGPSFVLLFVAASMPFGWLADVTSRRVVIFGGLACWCAATAACGLAQDFHHLLVARFAVGLGEAALMPSAMSLIASYFPPDRRNRGYGIYMTGASLGRATAFGGGGALFAWFAARGGVELPVIGRLAPWQAVFMAAGLLGIGIALLFLATVREPIRTSDHRKAGNLRECFVHLRRHRWAYLAIFMPFSMTSATAVSLGAWAVSFYRRDHGLDTATASAMIGATGLIVGPIGAMFGGWINDHLFKRGRPHTQPLVLVAILLGSALSLALFAFARTVPLAAFCYALAYAVMCASGATGLGGVQLPTPDHLRGVMSSIFLMFYTALGAGLGPFIVGFINDHLVGDRLGMALASTALILAVIGLPFGLLGQRAFLRAVRENAAA